MNKLQTIETTADNAIYNLVSNIDGTITNPEDILTFTFEKVASTPNYWVGLTGKQYTVISKSVKLCNHKITIWKMEMTKHQAGPAISELFRLKGGKTTQLKKWLKERVLYVWFKVTGDKDTIGVEVVEEYESDFYLEMAQVEIADPCESWTMNQYWGTTSPNVKTMEKVSKAEWEKKYDEILVAIAEKRATLGIFKEWCQEADEDRRAMKSLQNIIDAAGEDWKKKLSELHVKWEKGKYGDGTIAVAGLRFTTNA